MRLHNKLARWQQQGLLTAEQSAAILEHERQRASSGWHGGLAFVGVFAIVIGILAVIAANWQLLPGWLKLGVHLLLNVAVALAALRQWQGPRVAQLCLLLWYGLTLTFIGLMGQVFHLVGSTASALLLWTLLTSPAIIAYATSRLVLVPWLFGTLLTLILAYVEYLAPLLDDSLLLPCLLFGAMLPAVFAIVAARLEDQREVLRDLLAALAALLAFVTGATVSQFWYVTDLRQPLVNSAAWITVLGAPVLAALLCLHPRLRFPPWLENVGNMRLLLLTVSALITLPFLLPWVDSALLAALSFISLFLVLGWIGHRTQNGRLVSLAIVVITLRIYIVYLEVFGTLLQTGFGLIFSGVLLLLMLRFARVLGRKVSFTPLRGESSTGSQP